MGIGISTGSLPRSTQSASPLGITITSSRKAKAHGTSRPLYRHRQTSRRQRRTFTVKKGLAVDGVVLGPDGKPLKGARIGVGPDRFGSNQIPDFVTEDDGKFSFAFGGTMSVCLTIQAKGCAPELNEFQMAGQPQKLTIQLSPAKTLSGTVTDAKGQPIAGAMVSIDTWREHRTLADDILTADGDGKFTWDQAPADTVYADVMADGYMRQRTVALTAGKENIVKLQFPAHRDSEGDRRRHRRADQRLSCHAGSLV